MKAQKLGEHVLRECFLPPLAAKKLPHRRHFIIIVAYKIFLKRLLSVFQAKLEKKMAVKCCRHTVSNSRIIQRICNENGVRGCADHCRRLFVLLCSKPQNLQKKFFKSLFSLKVIFTSRLVFLDFKMF